MRTEVRIHECHGLPKHPIKLESRALHVMDKLRDGGTLGIFGMGGIGKTTLAKQAFQIMSIDFECTCFVDNVKGIPLHGLDPWILDRFHKNGKRLSHPSWSDFKARKSLIVMDDVDRAAQLKVLPDLSYFGAGSCIIVTSRDKDTFTFYEDGIIYEVDFLEDDDAKRLFRQHAFGDKDVPGFLVDHVNAVVKKCGGLPLTLEVIGTYLRGKHGKVWVETIDRLTHARAINGGKDDGLWHSLRISYNALQKEEQEMFAEAALFFFEQPLDEALAAWSSLTQNTQTTWENLVSRSLVKEIDNRYGQTVWEYESGLLVKRMQKTVWVHEHLRDLAAHISKGITISGSDETANSAVNLLNDEKAKASPKGLRLLHSEDFEESRRTLEFNSLAKLKRLKYVDLYAVPCQGRGNGVTRKISLLKVYPHKSYSKFEFSLTKMANLAVLELSHFVIPKEFPEALGNLTNLHILRLCDLKGLDHLAENFGHLGRLRQLQIRMLSSLILPKSFGNLVALENLMLSSIKSLQLPESFGDLSSLVKLKLCFCEKIGGLPDSFGANLTSLKELEIQSCPSIKCLPESLGDVSSLVKLSISRCSELAGLPDSFGGSLTSLEELSISGCPLIKCLPQSFCRLPQLKKLSIVSYRGFQEVGEEFGKLSTLRQLSLDGVALTRLPASFSLLSELETLTIRMLGKLSLPKDFGHLVALQDLTILADELQTLPDSFCALKSLRKLCIQSSKLERLPSKIGNLSALEELVIIAPRVEGLPDSTGQLCNLRKLILVCDDKLMRLPEIFGQLVRLQHLRIHAAVLRTLPDSFSALESLRKLKMKSSKLEGLPSKIGNLSALEELVIIAPRVESLPDSTGQLCNLRKLTLETKTLMRLPENFGELVTLQDLRIGADDLQTLPDSFPELKSLKWLSMGSSKLGRLPGNFGNLSSLEEISIKSTRLERLPESIVQLRFLKKLTLEAGETVRTLLHGIGQICSLEVLQFDCDGHEERSNLFAPITNFSGKLTLRGVNTRILPTGLGSLTSLKSLELSCMYRLEKLPDDLGKLASLERLNIVCCSMLKRLPDSLGHLSFLKEVRLVYCDGLKSLPGSLGQSSVTSKELPQRDHMEELTELQPEGSLQTKKTEGALRLFIKLCDLLTDSVLESFGWMRHNTPGIFSSVYLREPLIESTDPR